MLMGRPLHGNNGFGLSTCSLAFFNEIQYATARLVPVDLDEGPEEIDVSQRIRYRN